MEPSGRQRDDEARTALLKVGARSYLEAVTALIAFRQEVQKSCRKVMETNLDDYASALKVRLASNEIQDIAWPSFAKWVGDGWVLGVQIVRKDIPKVRWWETYCSLEFEFGEEGLFCSVCAWFPSRKMATEVFGKLHHLDPKVLHSGNEVWLQHGLKDDEVAVFEDSLQAVFQRWTEIWGKIGGIKDVFKG